MSLGQHTVGGEIGELLAAHGTVGVELGVMGKLLPDPPQCLPFQPHDRIALDLANGVQGPARGRQTVQLGAQGSSPGNLLDAEVERVGKSTAAGVVGTGLDGTDGRHRAEGIDEQQPGTQAGRPLA